MTATDWEATNQAYLQQGMAWLRDRLSHSPGDGSAREEDADATWWCRPEWQDSDHQPALESLGDLFGLSRFERLVLLLCVAPELDLTIGARCAEVLGDTMTAGPTLGLALSIIPEPAWDALATAGPLRHWRLLEVHGRPDQALISAPVRADERVVDYIRGLDVADGRLEHLCAFLPLQLGDPLPPSHERTVEEAVGVWLGADRATAAPILELVGPDPVVRAGLAAEVADRVGLACYELAPERLLSDPEPASRLLLWRRETVLRRLALFVDASELRVEDSGRLASLLVDAGSAVIIGGRHPLPVPRRAVYVVDARRPTTDEQEALWDAALTDRDPIDPQGDAARASRRAGVAAELADKLDLNQVTIRTVVRQAAGTDQPDGLWRACRAFARPRLEAFAQHLTTPAAWGDLVLPDHEMSLLHRLVDQVRGRATVLRRWGLGDTVAGGSGVTALFAGQSGTGKTMAAGVVAHELDLALYRIDLSAVVSKYIGETERNLSRVFDAADAGGVLLLFDEADALFGQRSEVKDSHDRYANIEVNYLLQRMEDYRGVAVLTTNQRHAVDKAFLRRLRFVVTFPFPAPAERRALWQRAFPERAPLEPLDLDHLAGLATTGGMIRNIALNAAYCAAGAEQPVSMSLVLEMAQVEFQKLQLPATDSDFRWHEPVAEGV